VQLEELTLEPSLPLSLSASPLSAATSNRTGGCGALTGQDEEHETHLPEEVCYFNS